MSTGELSAPARQNAVSFSCSPPELSPALPNPTSAMRREMDRTISVRSATVAAAT
jgi:hypothetical protein